MKTRLISLTVYLFVFAVVLLLPTKVVAASGPNLIADPSMEDSGPSTWTPNDWGSLTQTQEVVNTAHSGSQALKTTITQYSSGDAKWYPNFVSVKPNTQYTFSDWYVSNVVSHVDIAVKNTSGQTNYYYLGNPVAANTWAQASYTFTTPANAQSLTVFHSLTRVGELTIDDFTLVETDVTPEPDPVAPEVSITSPANGAELSGTTSIQATATDSDGTIASVTFKIDGSNIASPDTSSPYSAELDTTAFTNGSHTITATATDNDGLTTTASIEAIINNVVDPEPDPVAPQVSITSPANGAELSETVTVQAEATDSDGTIVSVQFQIDGVDVGTADTSQPYSFELDTKTLTNGNHTITTIATDNDALTATSSLSININNPQEPEPSAPEITIISPKNNDSVSGTIEISADASDQDGSITQVQFSIDGQNIGSADSQSPYSLNWDSTQVANGNHTITALATDNDGLTTSSSITISVENTITPPPQDDNLITNPGLETSSGSTVTGWQAYAWGSNNGTYSHLDSGHTGDHAGRVEMTQYTNGAVNWYFNQVAVSAGTTYTFSDWYRSDVDTEIDAAVQMSDGSTQYYYVGYVPASTNWQQIVVSFTAPAGAATMQIYHLLMSPGYLETDDYSLTSGSVPEEGFDRPIISLTFDDGWRSIYEVGLPLLEQYGLVSTQYLLTETITYPDYMTVAMMAEFRDKGHEIASHTISHPDLTKLNTTNLHYELSESQRLLESWLGIGVTNFASPYGAYNTIVLSAVDDYYSTHRSVESGYNTKSNFDPYNIKVQNVLRATTLAEVQGWIDQAITDNSWLVLVYHEVDSNPADNTYSVSPDNFAAQLNAISQSGVSVQTVADALTEISPQL